MISFSCPHCAQKLNLKDESAGKRGKCPKCQGLVVVPTVSGAAATVPTGDGSLSRLSAVSVNAAAPSDSRVSNPVAEQDATIVQPSKNLVPLDENAATIKQATDTRPQLSSPVSPARMPETFGRYKIRRELGRGAMGAVYLALDTNLDREVALKVPQFGPDTSGEEIARFYREARAMATVHHPNLCSVYDVGSESGVHYLTMAFIRGRSLNDCIKSEAPLESRRVAGLVAKLAAALDEAHQAGIVHRDLKPANIMLDQRQEPIVMDFGLARRNRENERELTQTGQLMGTPMYMAPEQVEGDHAKIGPGTDIYALGVIMFQMLCGRPPFEGSLGTMLSKIVTQMPPRPTTFRAEIDPELEAICLKAMAKQPADRFASAAELGRILLAFLEKHPTESLNMPLQQRMPMFPVPEPAAETGATLATGTWQPPDVSTNRATPPAIGGVQPATDASGTKPSGRRQPPLKLIAAGFAGVLLLVGLIVIVRNQAGREVAPIDVPEGGAVETKEATPTVANFAPPLAIAPFDAAQARAHQAAWAKYLNVPMEWENSIGMKFVLIPPGEFVMGIDPQAFDLEKIKWTEGPPGPRMGPVLDAASPHRVRLTRPFYLHTHDLSRRFFERVLGRLPNDKPERPEEPLFGNVSWFDCLEFCDKLSELEGRNSAHRIDGDQVTLNPAANGYRLPTEAEWEFACRAGTQTYWWFGDDRSILRDVFNRPNPFGLYQMYGGSNEWCWDTFARYPADEQTDPVVAPDGKTGIQRGGTRSDSAGGDPFSCNSFSRTRQPARKPGLYNGFGRVVLPIESAKGVAVPVPSVPNAPPAVYLDDLQEVSYTGGMRSLGRHGLEDSNERFTYRGQQVTHSLLTHPRNDSTAKVIYRLDGKFQTLEMKVGFADKTREIKGRHTYRVLGDGRELWKSPPFTKPEDEAVCSVSVAGVRELQLELICVGDAFHGYAAWLNPRLTPVPPSTADTNRSPR